jgi:hypothetical protein
MRKGVKPTTSLLHIQIQSELWERLPVAPCR